MKTLNFVLPAFIALLLSACSNAPMKPHPPSEPIQEIPKQPPTADELIQEANESGSLAYSAELKLQAARLLTDNQEPARAFAVYSEISPRYLSPDHLRHYILLGLKLAVDQDSIEMAQQLLDMRGDQFEHTGAEQQGEYAWLVAKALSLSGQHYLAAQKRILSANLYSDEEYWNNHELIWKNLRLSSLEQLVAIPAPDETNNELTGWIELARAIKQNMFSLDKQLRALIQWQGDWPDHPAARHLPGELNLLATLPDLRPERITVALPLSGKLERAGKSILEGFLAAFYNDTQQSASQTRLSIIDTSKSANIRELVESIHLTSPGLVIGPLRKTLVEQLASYPDYKYKTITLNYTLPEEGITESGIYQFGLSFQDELNQIAEQAWLENVRSTLIFCPNNNWGQRTCNQLESVWLAKNGIVSDIKLFDPKKQHTFFIEEALKVNQSKARKRELQMVIGEQLEFEPRRRQDIDAIFLIANSVNGRQIKPLLSFYYAGNLPVYATSTIYSGKPEPTRNLDLSNIMFTETPWVLNTANPTRHAIEQAWPKLASKYTRLFALGTDAFLLSSRLPLLEQIPDIYIPGNSGLLSLKSNRQIHRHLEWATFEKGNAIVMTDKH